MHRYMPFLHEKLKKSALFSRRHSIGHPDLKIVDDLSDFSKGQAFECFHCYKQAHIVIACCVYCVYCLFFISISASVLVYCIFLYVCIFFSFFSSDATILVNEDVYKMKHARVHTQRVSWLRLPIGTAERLI